MTDITKIGQTMKALRIKKKLTQADIKRKCGIQEPYQSRLENGVCLPSLPTLAKYADALEIKMVDFFK